MVAEKLFGVNFRPIEGVDIYHPEVKTFEVLDSDSSHLSLFYADYFPPRNQTCRGMDEQHRGTLNR